jgi:hypothetical protein
MGAWRFAAGTGSPVSGWRRAQRMALRAELCRGRVRRQQRIVRRRTAGGWAARSATRRDHVGAPGAGDVQAAAANGARPTGGRAASAMPCRLSRRSTRPARAASSCPSPATASGRMGEAMTTPESPAPGMQAVGRAIGCPSQRVVALPRPRWPATMVEPRERSIGNTIHPQAASSC